ncbi:hypothetical protein ACHAXM_006509 [Skeletonema potamos]
MIGSHTSRKRTLILVINLLCTHSNSLFLNNIFHFGNEREGGEEDDFGTSLGLVYGAGVFH